MQSGMCSSNPTSSPFLIESICFLLLTVVLIVTTAPAGNVDERNLRESWKVYKAKFWKDLPRKVTVRNGLRASNETANEEQERFALFEKTVKEITAHNARFARGEVTSRFGINKFSTWTENEKRSLLGLKTHKAFSSILSDGHVVEPKEHGSKRNKRTLYTPDYWDWRNKGVVTRVKDQGSCGTCWAFSLAGAIEGQMLLKRQKINNDSTVATEDQSLSTQQLVDCGTSSTASGCDGAWPMDVLKRMSNMGIVKDSDYPITNDKGRCKTELVNTHAVVRLLGEKHVQPVGSDDALMQAVTEIGPISVAVDASDWFFFSGGIANCSSSNVNHAVLVVGFGKDNATNQRYRIIKNSWGSRWGDDGNFRMFMNNNSCGASTYAVYPIVALM